MSSRQFRPGEPTGSDRDRTSNDSHFRLVLASVGVASVASVASVVGVVAGVVSRGVGVGVVGVVGVVAVVVVSIVGLVVERQGSGAGRGRGRRAALRGAARLLPARVRQDYLEEWQAWLADLRDEGQPWYRHLVELLSIVLIAGPRLAVRLRWSRQGAGS
jgi:hypothetical protein